ncbi:FIST signal transduction protein [Synechococcus sp. CBW1004]|uniref:FIST signal transduction protein n=1 Tax=Synechococcus sp. CBW1004 TaxID=1353136 RepID=UPI001E2A880A|nr:FIST N-terminal domain-containing protein [Synechococcus sp. CBW1004]
MVPATQERTRWIRVGSSLDPDNDRAVEEALQPLLQAGKPKLVLLFASATHDLECVASRLADAFGEDVVIGCSTAGELAPDRSSLGGLTLWALGGEGFTVSLGMGQGGPEGLRQAANEAAHCLDRLERRAHTVLVLLADGLCGDQVEVVRGAYDVAGVEVPLVGGCAGDDLAMQRTHQVFGRRLLRQSVVAAAISSDAPLGIGVSHCWEPRSAPMLVTASTGTEVISLDDRPALDVLLEAFEAPEDVRTNAEIFTSWVTTRPLGIRRRDRIEIRYVAGADFTRRSLKTIAEVPQGGLAHLMQGDGHSVLEATQQACEMAAQALEGQPMQGLLLFDCVARRSVLAEDRIVEEVQRINSVRGDLPVGGFYTYGEIARTRGAGGFHNQTLVALALA